MSLAEIKAEVAKLTPAERAELRDHLASLKPFDDPAFMSELDRRHDEMERGINVVSSEEMYRRLRTAGRDI